MKNIKNIEKFGFILMSRNYSKNTVETYMSCMKNVSLYFNCDTSKVTNEQLQEFLINRVNNARFSFSDQNQHINAIRLYYLLIHNKTIKPKYTKRPRTRKRLPVVLNTDEMSRIMQQIKNLKHKTIIFTIYTLGLRISEAVNLRIADIDSKSMRVYVRNSKGGKDRAITLQPDLLILLREYYKTYHPHTYLFNGQFHLKYSTSSITNVFQRAVRQAGIKKRVTVHTLRHTYATHLLEENLPLRTIQKMLGHKSSRTTEIYTHITDKAMEAVRLPKIKIA